MGCFDAGAWNVAVRLGDAPLLLGERVKEVIGGENTAVEERVVVIRAIESVFQQCFCGIAVDEMLHSLGKGGPSLWLVQNWEDSAIPDLLVVQKTVCSAVDVHIHRLFLQLIDKRHELLLETFPGICDRRQRACFAGFDTLLEEPIKNILGIHKVLTVDALLVPFELVNNSINDDSVRPLREKRGVGLTKKSSVAEAPVVHILLPNSIENAVHIGSCLRGIDVFSMLAHSILTSSDIVVRPCVQLSSILVDVHGMHRCVFLTRFFARIARSLRGRRVDTARIK
ncbi:hypothetical protein HG530_006697 [Fusarium avenaceum]|nr:hypothetical protein HG530_006697 [Fusarium avenaceum]